MDHIEWDLLSPLTPEAFAKGLCADIGLSGEAIPLIAHALHEEILKHKKDAIEWGVIGGDIPAPSAQVVNTRSVADAIDEVGSTGGTRAGTRAGSVAAAANPGYSQVDKAKERSVTILAPLKDKTGLGIGLSNWGRAPRDGLGRGPRALKSVWRDWSEAEEFATRFEVLTAEEVERREIERERASRYAFTLPFITALSDIKIYTAVYGGRHQSSSSVLQDGDVDHLQYRKQNGSVYDSCSESSNGLCFPTYLFLILLCTYCTHFVVLCTKKFERRREGARLCQSATLRSTASRICYTTPHTYHTLKPKHHVLIALPP